MLERILISLIIQAGSALLTYVTTRNAKKQIEPADELIDARVNNVKVALSEALDGKPATKEQRDKLNSAFRDLVRPNASSLRK